ncbi:MAG: BMP family ABC transporter substrate-binding protein [Acidimicrobiales bacterium]
MSERAKVSRFGKRFPGVAQVALVLGALSIVVAGSATVASAAKTSHKTGRSRSTTVGLKTGWIYDGSVGDKGYDEEWYLAQQYLEHNLGIKATYTQNTPYTSQWTTTGEGMVASGAKILFDPGDGGSLFYAACAKYPKVACVESNGVKPFPNNVVSLYDENWLPAYLEGMAAGLLTKTGKIGFLAAFSNLPAPVNETLNALVLGCQSTHPGCKAIVDVVNSWYNPPKETEDANALIDAGADVIGSTENDPVAVVVAQKRHVWGLGSWGNSVSSGPNSFVTSQIINWAPALEQLTKQVADGTFRGGRIEVFGFGPGLRLAPWGSKVPQSVRTKVNATYAQMKSGKNLFCGPIYDTSGKLRVSKGKCLSTMYIYDQWNWYVRGVTISK